MPSRGATARRRRRILDAATELAIGGGYDAVSVREVAARSGLAAGSLYRHHPSKDAILVAVLDDWLERFADADVPEVAATACGQPIRLQLIADRIANAAAAWPLLTEATLRAYLSVEHGATPEIARIRQRIVDLLIDCSAGACADDQHRDVVVVTAQVWMMSVLAAVNGRRPWERLREDMTGAAQALGAY